VTRVPDEYRVSTLLVRPWLDAVGAEAGYDPRSEYAEHFWLPLLGPSTVALLRRLAMGLDQWPDGFECSTRELSWSLGLGRLGPGASFGRILRRSEDFGMARLEPDSQLLVRRLMPPVPLRMVRRLPVWLQEAHREYQGAPLTGART
jgi:hypothetical protein